MGKKFTCEELHTTSEDIKKCKQNRQRFAISLMQVIGLFGSSMIIGLLFAVIIQNQNGRNNQKNNGFTYEGSIQEYLFFLCLILACIFIPIFSFKYLSTPVATAITTFSFILNCYIAYIAASYIFRSYQIKKIVVSKIKGSLENKQKIGEKTVKPWRRLLKPQPPILNPTIPNQQFQTQQSQRLQQFKPNNPGVQTTPVSQVWKT